jgi:hypothetical protein
LIAKGGIIDAKVSRSTSTGGHDDHGKYTKHPEAESPFLLELRVLLPGLHPAQSVADTLQGLAARGKDAWSHSLVSAILKRRSGGVVKPRKRQPGRPLGGRIRVTFKFRPEVDDALFEAASTEGDNKERVRRASGSQGERSYNRPHPEKTAMHNRIDAESPSSLAHPAFSKVAAQDFKREHNRPEAFDLNVPASDWLPSSGLYIDTGAESGPTASWIRAPPF